jgi:hypothetical protein
VTKAISLVLIAQELIAINFAVQRVPVAAQMAQKSEQKVQVNYL